MRVTEQIDALTTLSTNPYKYLVVPRLIAAVVTLPILVLLADIIGVLGGFLVGFDATVISGAVPFIRDYFGLGGSVWSSDRDRAFEVAVRINSGTVWVNKHQDLTPDTPYGGAKQSGIGVEMGREGLEEFTQATIINVAK